MRHAIAIVILAATSFESLTVTAETPAQMPAMAQSYMQIPWADFRAMYEALNAAKEKPVSPPKPPVPWAIVDANYAAEARPDNSGVIIVARFRVQVWEPAEWLRIPLVDDSVAVTSVMLDDKPANVTADGQGQLTLLHQGAGEHNVEMTLYVTASENEGVVSFEFPCIESAVTHMTLRVPVKDARIESHAASNTNVTVTDVGVEAEMAFPKTQKLAASWTLPAKLPVPAPVAEPRVACTAWTLVVLSETYVSCTAQLRYQVLRGGVDSFALELPSDVNVLEVAGQGAAWSRQNTTGSQRIEIKTNHRIGDSYTVTISYESPFAGELAKIPIVRISNVVRETGYAGIAARGNVEVSAAAAIEGLTRLDTAELPVELRAMSSTPLLLAFRHGEGNRMLAVELRKLKDVAVPDSTIDYASLTTLITEDGMAVTRASYEVRNSLRQFLRIRVDEDAEIWSAFVGDRVVKPARDAKTGEVLVPLSKSVEIDRRLGSFPVQLLYMQHVAKPKGLWSTTSLTAPATDILASSVSWEVLLPEQRPLYNFAGDLAAIASPVRAQAFAPNTASRPTSVTRQDTLFRLREGVERFFMTDINNPASQSQQGAPRYAGPLLAPQQAGASKSASSVAGVLPVPITLPETGVPYRFGKVLAEQGKPLALSLVTVPRALITTLRCIAMALSVLAGVTFTRIILDVLKRTRVRKRNLAAFAACANSVAYMSNLGSVSIAASLLLAAGAAAIALMYAWLRRRGPIPYAIAEAR